jgi:hypothetical protein
MKTARILIPVLALLLAVSLAIGPAQAQSGNVWRMDFFSNTFLIAPPVFSQQASFLNFNWGLGSPAPQVPVDFFSGRFTTEASFTGGVWTFSVVADDGFTLRVNDVIYIDTYNAPQPGKSFSADIPLSQGIHRVQVDYNEQMGQAFISVNWFFNKPLPPGVVVTPGPTPPPTTNVPAGQSPFSSPSVVTRYGDYTPCIQQQIHQSNCFVSDGAWDSPNLGSIQMEPQIVLWRNCTANQQITQQLFPGQPAVPTICSRTLAGFFPQ